jgi:hypothetical protein
MPLSTFMTAVVAAILLFPFGSARADYRFGEDEEIHHIEDVTLKGANSEALYLGYMTKTKNFIAGYSVEDAGYVLGVKGESKKFYPMPTGEELARFQKAGHLPDPLPPYRPGFWTYFMGYSLWWILALVGVWWIWDEWRKRRKKAEAPEAAPQG